MKPSNDDSSQKNDEILSKENEEIIKDTNAGTFNELQNKINNGGSEITLDKNYSCEDGFSTDGITISKQITIDGKGHTIDAQRKAEIFRVQANNVILKNIIFKNGKSVGYSGAIFWNGAAGSVSGCTFVGNSAEGYGGAILWNTGDDGSVSGCTFVGNSANGGGGAIFWNGAAGSVSGCTFVGNSANGDGGAIYWNGAVGSVSGCTFVGNSANGGAGAIHWPGTAGSADTCIFKTSSDTTYKTRILSPTLNVDNFTSLYGSGEKITFNLTTNSGIPVTNGNISISVYFKNGTWVRNYTCLSGEGWTPDLPVGYYYAIFNTEYAGFQPINRTISVTAPEHTFRFLNYTINGNDNPMIELYNDFYFDPAYDADFINGIVINRSVTINGNGFTINAKGKARIFEVLVDNVVVKNIVFKNGNITGDGGAVHFGGSGTVENCNFTNNSAGYAGGAIHMYSGSVENCIFINNTARYGGAIRFYNDGTTTNCNFTNNKAIGTNSWGGAICFSNIGNITNCNFAGNTAEGGGAVYFMNNGAMSNCNFAGNTAEDGGAISMFSGNVSNSTFTDNTADVGGAISMFSGNVLNCNFVNNSAADVGGAISMNYGTVINCKFTNNKADTGSAINSDLRCSVVNCSFVNNIATGIYSGAIDMCHGSVLGCIFDNNSANRGAAIRFFASSNNLVSGCIFMNHNNGNEIIYFDRGNTLTVNNNIFLNNSIDAIVFNQTDSSSNCDYNWFGADASNYMIDPNLPNCNVWLFLNATANPDVLSLGDVSKITFKLYAFNSSSNKTSEYNNGLLYPVDLALTAVNGNTNTTNIHPGDAVQFMATKLGKGSVTTSISTTSFTVYLNIKSDSNMLVESQEIEYGEEYIIQLKYNVTATGKVNITLKGKKSNLTFTDLDLNNTIALGIIPADEYNVIVIYSGDDLFINGTANGTLIVNMAKTQITADAIITTYNIDKDLVITLKDSNGNPVSNATVTVDLNAVKTYTTDTNGQVKVSTAGLVPKIYTAKISFAGDNNYNGSSMDVGVTVNKATPILKAKKKTYKAKTKTKKFTIVLKDNTGKPIKNAKVRLMVKKITKSNKKGGSDKESKADKKKNFAVTNNKGKATFKVLRNKKGKYNAKVKFYSNENYNKVTKTVKILIK